jgi:hypothetical protein
MNRLVDLGDENVPEQLVNQRKQELKKEDAIIEVARMNTNENLVRMSYFSI